jgi:osmotically-inducible protein OsmY
MHTTDMRIKSIIVEELKWSPGIDSTHIGVGVLDGAVTLSGEVASYPEKRLAEEAVRKVKGVHAVAGQLTVKSEDHGANDTDIAREAGDAIGRAVDIARNAVTATVQDHVITLHGEVPWHYQRESAARSVRYLPGVSDVRNELSVTPYVATSDIRREIEAALARHAVLGAKGCSVRIDHRGAVTITGTVSTLADRDEIGRVAWAASGVTSVHNEVQVRRYGS